MLMQIRNMRWGCAVPGNYIAEIVVTDDHGCNFFLLDSRVKDRERVIVSATPLFDIVMESRYQDVDMAYEYEKLQRASEELYDMSSSEVPERMLHSRFAKIIGILRSAMQACCEEDDPDDASAKRFIAPYLHTYDFDLGW